MSKCVLFLAIFAAQVIFVILQYNIRPFEIKTEHLNKRLLGHLLYEIQVIELLQCTTECIFLGACESINFNRRNKTCELNDEGSETASTSEFVEEKGTVFSDISEFREVITGVCSSHKCTDKQRCYPMGSDYVCKTIGCGDPPHVLHGVFEPGGNIAGNLRKFSCPVGLVIDGTENISCLHNGKWTHFDTACRHEYRCPSYPNTPDFTLFDPHADGIRVGNSTFVIFQAKGTQDAAILLQRDRNVFTKNVITVVLGGYHNTRYMIYVTQESDDENTYLGDLLPHVLSRDVYQWFWISWDKGCVKAGAGNAVSLNVGMQWCGLKFTVSGIRVGFGWKERPVKDHLRIETALRIKTSRKITVYY